MLCSFVLFVIDSNWGSNGTSWIELLRVPSHFPKIRVCVYLRCSRFVSNGPHHNTRVVSVPMNELLNTKFVIRKQLIAVVSVEVFQYFLNIHDGKLNKNSLCVNRRTLVNNHDAIFISKLHGLFRIRIMTSSVRVGTGPFKQIKVFSK